MPGPGFSSQIAWNNFTVAHPGLKNLLVSTCEFALESNRGKGPIYPAAWQIS